VAEDGDTAGLAFILAPGGWYAVQATEQGSPPITPSDGKDGAAVFIFSNAPISRSERNLRPISNTSATIASSRTADAMALFGELIKQPGEPSAKLGR
jgi:hypothetical protein